MSKPLRQTEFPFEPKPTKENIWLTIGLFSFLLLGSTIFYLKNSKENESKTY
jgi:hypothetical protein